MYDIDLMRDTDVAFLALTGTVGHVRALVIRGLPGGSPFFRFRNQMTKRGVGFDTLHFVLDDLIHLDTDAVVVLLDLTLHAILPVLVLEEGDLRYGNVGFLFAGDGGGIDDNLGVKNLVLYHTEDKNIKKRKELYGAEGREYYHGNLFIPDDLDVIEM